MKTFCRTCRAGVVLTAATTKRFPTVPKTHTKPRNVVSRISAGDILYTLGGISVEFIVCFERSNDYKNCSL